MGSSAFFHSIEEPPFEPFYHMRTRYANDTFEKKVDLTWGSYTDENGRSWQLPTVREAEKLVAQDLSYNHEYLPIDGLPKFQESARELLFGSNDYDGRIATVQTIGAAGGLFLGFELTKKIKKKTHRITYMSKETWANHEFIIKESLGVNCEIRTYRYFDEFTKGLDFDGLLSDLNEAPSYSLVILQLCGHNPTGADPTIEQWKRIFEVVKQRNLIPLFDNAYQGFASGDLETDAEPIRILANFGDVEFMVACSFSKIMGIYNSRVGALHVFTESKQSAKLVKGALKAIIRATYSNPMVEGASAATYILQNEKLKRKWIEEMKTMPKRLNFMRERFKNELERLKVPGDWSFVTKQKGMFIYGGLTPEQIEDLITNYHIHMTVEGRMCVCGMNESNVRYVAESFAKTQL